MTAVHLTPPESLRALVRLDPISAVASILANPTTATQPMAALTVHAYTSPAQIAQNPASSLSTTATTATTNIPATAPTAALATLIMLAYTGSEAGPNDSPHLSRDKLKEA